MVQSQGHSDSAESESVAAATVRHLTLRYCCLRTSLSDRAGIYINNSESEPGFKLLVNSTSTRFLY